jgi:hypothetical protein
MIVHVETVYRYVYIRRDAGAQEKVETAKWRISVPKVLKKQTVNYLNDK